MKVRLGRRSAVAGIAGVAACAGWVRFPAGAAQFEYKFAHSFPASHPFHVRAVEMWNAVRDESGGRLAVATFSGGQLGTDAAVMTQLRSGAIQLIAAVGANLAAVAPAAAIESLGFAFGSSDEALSAMNGPLGEYVCKQVEAKGIFIYRSVWDIGMRHVTSSIRPLVVPADFAGLKIRVVPSKILVELFSALGASPTPLDFSEVYTALQTKTVDAQETPLGTIEAAKLYEVQKYLSLTSHAWAGEWFLGNPEAIAALPADVRAVVARNVAKYAQLEHKDLLNLDASLTAKLKSQGLAFNTVDLAALRAKVKPYYARWRTEFGEAQWNLLEKTTGKLV